MREQGCIAEVSLSAWTFIVPRLDGDFQFLLKGVLFVHQNNKLQNPEISNFPPLYIISSLICYTGCPHIGESTCPATQKCNGVIIIMLGNNNSYEGEQCFDDREGEQSQLPEQQLKLDLPKRIKDHLPANELRTIRRPDNMAPRTFFLDSPRTLVHQYLNYPCEELPPVPPNEPTRLKLRILNSKNIPIEEYFQKERFRCLYSTLDGTRPEGRTFLGRLKGIDSLVDYNWKNFRELPPPITPIITPGNDRIDADFQNGNLCRVYQGAQERQYYLLVQNDVNTYGYNNWFFFRCSNSGNGIRRFTIANLVKKTSFFGQGMQVSIFSRRRWSEQGIGWFKGGQKVTFGSINFLRTHHDNEYYSCLAFEYDFAYDDDEVFFALNQPYTYSRLVRYLQGVREGRRRYQSGHIQVKNIGFTIANNIIPTVKINKNHSSTDIVLVIARQHPCETTGSFIAEYLMKYLIEEGSQVVKHLLEQFEFVIVPMVNPDGVIHGMSRCNMSGLDLNRQWGEDTLKELTPEVVKVKQLIASLSKTKRIKYMLDLHGHGKKLSSFFFCCSSEKQHYRLLSLAMRKIQRRFSLAECTYGISRDKQNTIRSKINSMGIGHSYTLETSLYGWRNQQGEVRHFNQNDYAQIAQSLLKSIFLIEAPPSLSLALIGTSKEMLASELGALNDPAQQNDKAFEDNNEMLSDSDPEGDRLDVKDLLCKCENKALKKKLEELERKKMKKKRKAKEEKLSARLSSKNMRQSCPTGFYSGKLSHLQQSALGREVLVKLQAKANAKKVSFSEKWEVRRRVIVQRQQKMKTQTAQRQIAEINSTPIPRHQRTRIKSQISTFINKKMQMGASSSSVASVTTKNPIKKKPLPHKMKTEFREVQEMHMLSQEEIKQSQSRKSALELRFKELKQESLNVILTDTLSISKMAPNEKEKEKERMHHPRSIKNMAQRPKSEYPHGDPQKTNAKGEEGGQRRGYKKFWQFMNPSGQSPDKKVEKSINSVFYYFPVL